MGVAPQYWGSLGLDMGSLNDGAPRPLWVVRLDIFNNNMRLPIWLTGAMLLIFRRFRLALAVGLVLYLSYGLTDRLNTRYIEGTEPIQRITPAMRVQADADAAVDLGAAPVVRQKLCEATMDMFFDLGHEGLACHPRMAQVTMRYVLMQIAYLENDPVAARRQVNALQPGDEMVMSVMHWRIMIVRQWLSARGYPPSAASFKPEYEAHAQMAPGVARIASWLAAVLGLGMAVGAGALIVMSSQIRRRVGRLNLMIGQAGIGDSGAAHGIVTPLHQAF